jgi:hypothetical protein
MASEYKAQTGTHKVSMADTRKEKADIAAQSSTQRRADASKPTKVIAIDLFSGPRARPEYLLLRRNTAC